MTKPIKPQVVGPDLPSTRHWPLSPLATTLALALPVLTIVGVMFNLGIDRILPDSPWFGGVLIWLACLPLVAGLTWFGILTGTPLLAAGAIFAWLGGGGFLYWTVPSSSPHAGDAVSSQIQLEDIQTLRTLLEGKNEVALWASFDLRNIAHTNVLGLIRADDPGTLSPEQAARVEEYRVGANDRASLIYGTLEECPDRCRWTAKPGSIAMIAISAKHLEITALLARLQESTGLPPQVREAVAELKKAVDQNVDRLFDALNATIKQSPKPGSPEDADRVASKCVNVHWSSRVELKPKADAVLQAIREWLGTD